MASSTWGPRSTRGSSRPTAATRLPPSGTRSTRELGSKCAPAAVVHFKALVERLDITDAVALRLDPDRVSYTAMADLSRATDKARRDAPAIAICDVWPRFRHGPSGVRITCMLLDSPFHSLIRDLGRPAP